MKNTCIQLSSLSGTHDRFFRSRRTVLCPNLAHCLDGNIICLFDTLLVTTSWWWAWVAEDQQRIRYQGPAAPTGSDYTGIVDGEPLHCDIFGSLQNGSVLSHGPRGLCGILGQYAGTASSLLTAMHFRLSSTAGVLLRVYSSVEESMSYDCNGCTSVKQVDCRYTLKVTLKIIISLT